jgi:hypothetical protein
VCSSFCSHRKDEEISQQSPPNSSTVAAFKLSFIDTSHATKPSKISNRCQPYWTLGALHPLAIGLCPGHRSSRAGMPVGTSVWHPSKWLRGSVRASGLPIRRVWALVLERLAGTNARPNSGRRQAQAFVNAPMCLHTKVQKSMMRMRANHLFGPFGKHVRRLALQRQPARW